MENKPSFSLVLNAPDIPGNTGSIGRTCVALGLRLILIRPYGFDLSEKAVRRAGLDYWKYVDLTEYDSFAEFINREEALPEQLIFFSRFAEKYYYHAPYSKDCYLIFGSETSGLPEDIFKVYPQNFYKLPMYSEHIRSLNLANTATAVAYEALRHLI